MYITLLCVILQILHFELALMLLLLLFRHFTFDSVVVPLPIMEEPWIFQYLSLLEIQQQM